MVTVEEKKIKHCNKLIAILDILGISAQYHVIALHVWHGSILLFYVTAIA